VSPYGPSRPVTGTPLPLPTYRPYTYSALGVKSRHGCSQTYMCQIKNFQPEKLEPLMLPWKPLVMNFEDCVQKTQF
jgi:hypothetical protein